MNIKKMQKKAESVAGILRVLAHEGRLLLLCQLADGEKSVGVLAERLGLPQAQVSQQLALLRREGLVTPRRDGQSIYYRINNDDALHLMQSLYDIFCAPKGGKK